MAIYLMNFSQLPLELIDEILKHLDAISLAKSRQVCRTWLALHAQPKYKQLWRQACVHDIRYDILVEITGDRTIFSDNHLGHSSAAGEKGYQKNYNIDWKAIYQRWFRSRHIGKWPCMITELEGHSGQVLDVKFSGDRVVTCGVDGVICIWDGWTGCCVMVFRGHLDSVTSISLRQTPGLWKNPSDTPHDLLASGSRDCSVKIWNMKEGSGVAVATCHGHNGPINCVSFGDNSFLASASEDCSVRIWRISTGNCTCYYTLSNLGDWVEHTRLWGSDTLLYVTVNGKLALSSIADQQILSSIRLKASNPLLPRVRGAVLRGQNVLVLTALNGLFFWESNSNNSILNNFPVIGPCSTGVVRGTCLAMHGALVTVGTSSTGAVYIYHLNGKWGNQFNKIHCVLQVNKSAVNAVSIDDDGQGPCLAAAGDDGIVKVYRWFPPSV